MNMDERWKLVEDLRSTIAYITGGNDVFISFRHVDKNNGNLWAIRGPDKNLVVMLYYHNEPNYNAIGNVVSVKQDPNDFTVNSPLNQTVADDEFNDSFAFVTDNVECSLRHVSDSSFQPSKTFPSQSASLKSISSEIGDVEEQSLSSLDRSKTHANLNSVITTNKDAEPSKALHYVGTSNGKFIKQEIVEDNIVDFQTEVTNIDFSSSSNLSAKTASELGSLLVSDVPGQFTQSSRIQASICKQPQHDVTGAVSKTDNRSSTTSQNNSRNFTRTNCCESAPNNGNSLSAPKIKSKSVSGNEINSDICHDEDNTPSRKANLEKCETYVNLHKKIPCIDEDNAELKALQLMNIDNRVNKPVTRNKANMVVRSKRQNEKSTYSVRQKVFGKWETIHLKKCSVVLELLIFSYLNGKDCGTNPNKKECEVGKHAEVDNEKSPTVTCSYCGKTFNLAENMKTPCSEPVCSDCDNFLNKTPNLNHDVNSDAHNCSVLCAVCGNMFRSLDCLNEHMRDQHPESHTTQHTPHKHNKLLKNIQVCTEEIFYQCSLCDKKFLFKSKLQQHEQVHSRNRLYDPIRTLIHYVPHHNQCFQTMEGLKTQDMLDQLPLNTKSSYGSEHQSKNGEEIVVVVPQKSKPKENVISQQFTMMLPENISISQIPHSQNKQQQVNGLNPHQQASVTYNFSSNTSSNSIEKYTLSKMQNLTSKCRNWYPPYEDGISQHVMAEESMTGYAVKYGDNSKTALPLTKKARLGSCKDIANFTNFNSNGSDSCVDDENQMAGGMALLDETGTSNQTDRDKHNECERKQRQILKSCFHDLRVRVPSVANNEQASGSLILVSSKKWIDKLIKYEMHLISLKDALYAQNMRLKRKLKLLTSNQQAPNNV